MASASSPSDLTDDDLENVIAAAGVTNAAFTDLDNLADYEADLIRDCMGTTVSTQNIQSCVSSATTETVNTQKVSGMIAGTYSGTPTVTDFQNAGIGTFDTATGDENVITFLNLNVCGSDGTSSCSIALGSAYTDASLVSAAGSSTTTKTALLNYLQDALADYTESMGNSIVGSTSDTGNSCGNVRIRAPFVCNGNPLFTCTALDGFSLTSDNRWIEKSVSAVSGVVSGRVPIPEGHGGAVQHGQEQYHNQLLCLTLLVEHLKHIPLVTLNIGDVRLLPHALTVVGLLLPKIISEVTGLGHPLATV